MKILKFFLTIIFILSFSIVNSSEKSNKLKNKISKNIRCLICQGQSVYDSQSDFAISVQSLIEQKLDEGFTEDEIYEFLKNQYGQWVVYEPEFNKNTVILWILPILLFLSGGVIIIKKLKIKNYED
jgi:cytochrome c-type biogenesis protein CcmH